MRVLHVEDRVLVVALERQVDVEGELGVGLPAQHEEADRVLAGPLDQVAQGHVGAGALGELDLLAVALDPHHGVEHVVRVAGRHAHVGGLQAGAHPGDRAVVVGALDVDRLGEAALELGQVIGDVGHEVGVAAVGLAHHAVLVVAVVGGAQPERAALLVGLARGDEPRHGRVDPAAGVQARLEVVVVEAHAEGGEVEVLLVAQVGDRELADAVAVVEAARGGELAVVGLDRLAGPEVGGDVGDVVAVVGVLGPARIARRQAGEPGLDRGGEGGDLHAGVVVIELAHDLPALGLEQVADRVAEGRLAGVADVQRAGRIGGDELDQHRRRRIGRLQAERVPRSPGSRRRRAAAPRRAGAG